jgi:hypothetical protein
MPILAALCADCCQRMPEVGNRPGKFAATMTAWGT